MRSRFTPSFVAGVCAPLIIVVTTIFWLWKGWGIAPPRLGPNLLPEFPWGSVAGALQGVTLIAVLTAAGRGVTAHSMRRQSASLKLAIAFLVGSALVGTTCALLGLAWIHGGIAFLVAGILIFQGRKSFRKIPLPCFHVSVSLESVAVAVVLITAFLAALAPAVESDGLRYHLVGPQEWLRAGRFVNIPYNANSNLPSLSGILVADAFGNSQAGRIFQLFQWANFAALLVVAPALSRLLFRSFVAQGSEKRIIAEGTISRSVRVVLAGIPVLGLVATWPFADVASVAPLIGAAWCFLPGSFRRRPVRIALGALLVGAALAAKISNLPLAGLLCAYALVATSPIRIRRFAWEVILTGSIVLLALLPWMVKSFVHHHNPFYPLGYSVMGGTEWSSANDIFYKAKLAEKGVGHDLPHFLTAPFDMVALTTKPFFEQQNPGPAFLAALPLCIVALLAGLWRFARRRRGSPILFFAALVTAGYWTWFKTYQSVRFLIPVMVFAIVLAIAFGYSIANRGGHRVERALRVCLALMGASSAAWLPTYLLSSTKVIPAALGLHGEAIFISSRFPSYTMVSWLNSNTEKNEPVFYVGEFRSAYAQRFRPLASDWFDTPLVLVEIQGTADNEALLREWRQRGIRHVLLNQGELSQYEALYFRPRFTEQEWQRFESLRELLLRNVVFDNGAGIFVCAVEKP